jgi:hypothetical protein
MSPFKLTKFFIPHNAYIEIGTRYGHGIVEAIRTGFLDVHSIEPTESTFEISAEDIQKAQQETNPKSTIMLYRGLPAPALKSVIESCTRAIFVIFIRAYAFDGTHTVQSRNGVIHPLLDVILALREFFHDKLRTPLILIEHMDEIAGSIPNIPPEIFMSAVKSTISTISPDYDFEILEDDQSKSVLTAIPRWWTLGSRL